MRVGVIVHRAEEGGYWAEVPSMPGCASQGETMEEVAAGMREAIGGYLARELGEPMLELDVRVIEVSV